MAGIVDHFVTTTGSDTYANSTNSATPCSLSTAFTAISVGGTAAAGDRIWIKSGSYTQRSASDTPTIDGTVVSPIIISGYNSSIGDLDTPTYNADGTLVTTNYPVIDYAATFLLNTSGQDYVFYRNIKITSAGAGRSGGIFVLTGSNSGCANMYVTNPSTNAAAIAIDASGSNNIVENCDAAITGASGGTAAIRLGTSTKCVANRIIDSQTAGITITGSNCVIVDNVFLAAVVGPAIDVTTTTASTAWFIRGNTIQGKTTGIRCGAATYTALNYFGDNHITDGTTAILSLQDGTSQLAGWFSHNRFRDNTTNVDGWDDWHTGAAAGEVTTDTGTATSDYIDTTTDKYTLISTAPGWRVSSVPGRDIGAKQHAEPTLTTAGNIKSGVSIGYADALVAGSLVAGGGGSVIGSPIIKGVR